TRQRHARTRGFWYRGGTPPLMEMFDGATRSSGNAERRSCYCVAADWQDAIGTSRRDHRASHAVQTGWTALRPPRFLHAITTIEKTRYFKRPGFVAQCAVKVAQVPTTDRFRHNT